MYIQTWSKYLPIIKILLKRAANGDQSLNLNVGDFEKLGSTRKAGYKFNIHFSNGRVDNVISSSEMAKDLASVLLGDPKVKELFTLNDYHVNMNAKFHLAIKFISKSAQPVNANELVSEIAV